MHFEWFVTRKILKQDKDNISGPYVRIAVIAITLGLAVMILSVAIVTGFQQEIRDKVVGFGSHIQIASFDFNRSFESTPVTMDPAIYRMLDTIPGIEHVQVFASKAGIVKTGEAIQGIIFKGIGPDYDGSFFRDKIVEGSLIKVSDSARTNDILISGRLAALLDVRLGDDIRVYFVGADSRQPRGRKFTIKGIYETGLEEFDEVYLIGDIGHIRRLNNWDPGQVAGYEVFIDDFNRLDELTDKIYGIIDYDLKATNVRELYPQIFDWLSLQDMNVVVIIVLMVMVSGITMISTLLVLILERTNTIGILKALGARSRSIREIFIYHAVYIIGKGLFWGNLLGLGIALIQKYTRVIPLSEESYYIAYVPIHLDPAAILYLNLGTLVVCTLMLLVPSYIIARITPLKAIRLD
ncbi:MAG: ABC transporter permease [Bacteroidetes bacterium]|nr:ABC transporter permease [Bacteroidota bacterium]